MLGSGAPFQEARDLVIHVLKENMEMRLLDFAPLTRSSIGFDRMFDLLQSTALSDHTESRFPPYNIERTGEDSYRISLAVAGFEPDQLSVTAEPDCLVVSGRTASRTQGELLHQGIAARPFEQRFNLADYVKVTGAKMENGLLMIDLVREVPEAMKPRRIQIASGGPLHIEGKAA